MIFFVSKIEEVRSNLDPDRPFTSDTVEFSGTPFAEFQLMTNDCVKKVLQEMPKNSCDLDPIPTLILHDCLEEVTPIVDVVSSHSVLNMLLLNLYWKRPILIQTA